jgi:putative membrane protein
MAKKNYLIWIFFFSFLFLVVVNSLVVLWGWGLDLETSALSPILFLGLPAVLIIWQAFLTLPARKVFCLFLISAMVGFTMEVVGLNFGVFFGGQYVYQANSLALLHVPLIIILFWAIFIYVGYSIVNFFLVLLKKKKPNKKRNDWPWLFLTVFLDGLVVVFIDLFMDPLQVAMGKWTWLQGGEYFGVPWGNFIGWFLVVILVTGVFRTGEYFFFQKEKEYDRSLNFLPLLSYGLLAIVFAFKAVEYHLPNLAFVGSFLMMPVVVVGLALFFCRKTSAMV